MDMEPRCVCCVSMTRSAVSGWVGVLGVKRRAGGGGGAAAGLPAPAEALLAIESPRRGRWAIGSVGASPVGMSRLLVAEFVLRLECALRRGGMGSVKGDGALGGLGDVVPGDGVSDVDVCRDRGGAGSVCCDESAAGTWSEALSPIWPLSRREGGGGGRGADSGGVSISIGARLLLPFDGKALSNVSQSENETVCGPCEAAGRVGAARLFPAAFDTPWSTCARSSESSSLEADSRSDLSEPSTTVFVLEDAVRSCANELGVRENGVCGVCTSSLDAASLAFPVMSSLLNESTSIAAGLGAGLFAAAAVSAAAQFTPDPPALCSFFALYLLSMLSRVFANGLNVPPLVYKPAESPAEFLRVFSSTSWSGCSSCSRP